MTELLNLQKLNLETAREEELALAYSTGICVGTGSC